MGIIFGVSGLGWMIAELFIDGYLEGCLSQSLRRPEGTIASDLESVMGRRQPRRHDHRNNALLEKTRMMYAHLQMLLEPIP